MNSLVYSDPSITITKEFIILPRGEREALPIAEISGIEISRKVTGDHRQAAVLFFMLGIFSIWFFIGFVFIALGIAAALAKTHEYSLMVTIRGKSVHIKTAKRPGALKDIARTIRGLATSRKVLLHLRST